MNPRFGPAVPFCAFAPGGDCVIMRLLIGFDKARMSVCTHCDQAVAPLDAHCPRCGSAALQESAQAIPTYLARSIIATFLCAFPLGFAGIIYGAQASHLRALGHIAAAKAASETARKCSLIGIWAGGACFVAYIALMLGSMLVSVLGLALREGGAAP